LALRPAKVEDEGGDHQWQIEQVHREKLADEEVQRRTGGEPAVVAPELNGWPAVDRFPDDPGDEKREGYRAAQPRPAGAKVVATRRQQDTHHQPKAEEEHRELG